MEKTDKTLAEMQASQQDTANCSASEQKKQAMSSLGQVDLNLNYDWSKICESGDKPLVADSENPWRTGLTSLSTIGIKVRLRGPGLVGLKNLGFGPLFP